MSMIRIRSCHNCAFLMQIAATLAKNVLTPRNQDVKVLNVGEVSVLPAE